MKKTALLLLISLFTIVGCKKDQKKADAAQGAATTQANWSEYAKTNEDILDDALMIGDHHNQGLDNIHTKLSNWKTTSITNQGFFNPTSQQIIDSIKAFAVEYLIVEIELHDSLGIVNLTSDVNLLLSHLIINDSSITPYFVSNFASQTFSREFKDSISKMLEIGKSQILTDTEKQEKWDQLALNTIVNLNDTAEKFAFAGAVKTAQASYSYWNDNNNYTKWNDLLGDNNPLPRNAFWEADAMGAIPGIFKGALAGVAAGPGGVVAGAVVNGIASGISASASYAILNKVFSSFGWD